MKISYEEAHHASVVSIAQVAFKHHSPEVDMPSRMKFEQNEYLLIQCHYGRAVMCYDKREQASDPSMYQVATRRAPASAARIVVHFIFPSSIRIAEIFRPLVHTERD